MLRYSLLLFFCLLIVFGCDKNKQKATEEEVAKKPEMSMTVKHSSFTKLDVKTEKEIGKWKEYTDVKEFLFRFENISPNEVLSNALELKDLTKKLKDSVRIEELKSSAFNARVNVLQNEALRLADMTYIPAITPQEVNGQVDKIFLVFGSLNAKINAHYKQKSLEKALDLGSFLTLDSTEMRKPNNLSIDKEIKMLKSKEEPNEPFR